MIPPDLQKYFWEYKANEIDEDKYWFFVIERLLEHGDDDSVKWVVNRYSEKKIIEVIKSSRNLSRKTANFWKNFFRLREEDIICLRELSPNQGTSFWTG